MPSEDPDERGLGHGWSVLADRDRNRDAIIQPPKPTVRPAAGVLQRAAPQIAHHVRDGARACEAEPG